VGNFDGSPMRGVSGVTGAGPLWNRIMLHLYERRDEPPPFQSPRGFVRTAICDTTGHAPDAPAGDCPAVVEEWALPRDLASIERPPRALRARYDAWLALQGGGDRSALSIVFPHDGDVFVRGATAGMLQRQEQQLALRAIGGGRPIEWRVGGKRLALDASGNAFWLLRLGTWRIEASDGERHAGVTIRVVSPSRDLRPGFTTSR
jgi:penicillin-binding protein 1C